MSPKNALLVFLGGRDVSDGQANWITTLITLWAAAHTVVCPMCSDKPSLYTCLVCRDTGQVPDPLALLRLCTIVAWECFRLADEPQDTTRHFLEATDDYLKDPNTYTSMDRVIAAFTGKHPDWMPVPVPRRVPMPSKHLEAACLTLGSDTVRRLLRRLLLR